MKYFTLKKAKIANVFASLLSLILVTMMTEEISAGQENHGFRLTEKRFVKEVNADCYYFEHVKSGAKLIKIAAADPNKTFSIAFKTFPESDNGCPHIMEHSVLNGSRNFPVKSPFDVLEKGSLNTFINAFTSKDFTMYPVASMNEKDYFNLMHVYLDAVFNPLIYTDGRILKQEGWHHELTDRDSAIVYKGVVYNEMKGSFSNPTRELWYQVFKNLFPDNGYGFESGGYPSAIPTLTQEAFIDYHKKYYHPGNSFIFLYGDGDLDKELDFIDRMYLSRYDRPVSPVTINDQKPFPEMKELTADYPVMEGASTADQAYLSLNFVTGHGTDQALSMSLDILCDVLVNQESAPVRLALQKAGIGQDVSASMSNFYQNVVQIVVQNANPGDADKFREIVLSTLREEADKGLDRKSVESVINRNEFLLREGNDAQKGLTEINRSLPGCLFAGDPFLGLEYEKPLAEVKKALTSRYLEPIILDQFVNNPHSLLLTLVPKPGMENEIAEQTAAELKAYKKSLDEASLSSLVKENEELIEYQKREDTPEALATIPMLDLADISRDATWYSLEEKKANGIPVLFHEEFSNDVVYADLYFDLRVLPEELIPYASLLSNVIGLLNTENNTYGDLDKELSIHTGGIYTSLTSFLENLDDSKMAPKFRVSGKAMNNKTFKLFQLTAEILFRTAYSDPDRLKTVITRHQSQLDASIRRNGMQYANTRLYSYFSNQGMFTETTSGMSYYWFVTELTKDLEKNIAVIAEKLAKTASILFTQGNLVVSSTCSGNDLVPVMHGVESIIKLMPEGNAGLNNWSFRLEKKNEGIQTASKVQYVVEGYNYKKLGYAWNGKLRVLSQVLSTDWLQQQIRVIGGAYGGFSSFSPSGMATFNSYRDPNLKETLDNYSGTVDYLRKFDSDNKTMTRYIIGTIASVDRPLTTSQKGDQAVTMYFNKRTRKELQQDREAVLGTSAADIRGFSDLVRDVIAQRALCVYGNSEKISANKDLFGSLVRIDQ
jgi:presequence protease